MIEKDTHVESEALTFAEFLEGTPPGKRVLVRGGLFSEHQGNQLPHLLLPRIRLHCPHTDCGGMRFFHSDPNQKLYAIEHRDLLTAHYCFSTKYTCSNCGVYKKVFTIALSHSSHELERNCFKIGEYPQFGPYTPSKLMELVGEDRELYLKGRRCESQGLGIGAFVYYRRVVENQKNKILDRIQKVATKLQLPEEDMGKLRAAKAETRFSESLKIVKDALPPSLLIDKQNPLTLLHSALSKGLHGRSDDDCLEIARSVRIVLSELSERLAQALKDEKELNDAVSKLLQSNKPAGG